MRSAFFLILFFGLLQGQSFHLMHQQSPVKQDSLRNEGEIGALVIGSALGILGGGLLGIFIGGNIQGDPVTTYEDGVETTYCCDSIEFAGLSGYEAGAKIGAAIAGPLLGTHFLHKKAVRNGRPGQLKPTLLIATGTTFALVAAGISVWLTVPTVTYFTYKVLRAREPAKGNG